MKITAKIALEVATHEAVVREAYLDSAGNWTWSVGLAETGGFDVQQYRGKPAPLELCISEWLKALERYLSDVEKAFAGYPLTETQTAAALSFHWNTGAIGKASWVSKVKAGDMAGARKSFLSWNKPPEVIGRRKKECALFFDGKWSQDGLINTYGVSKNGHIIWKSIRRIRIDDIVRRHLDPHPGPKPVDHVAPPRLPTAKPSPVPTEIHGATLWGVILLLAVLALVAFRH